MFTEDESQFWSTYTSSTEAPPLEKDTFLVVVVVMAAIGTAVCLIALTLLTFCIIFYLRRAVTNIFHLFFGVHHMMSLGDSSETLFNDRRKPTNYSGCEEGIPRE